MQNEVPVSIEQIMARNEERVRIQHELLAKVRCVVSFSLNIPGEVKTTALTMRCFEEGESIIQTVLSTSGITVEESQRRILATGPEVCMGVDGNPPEIKKLMLCVEESSALGRLFDIDVIGPDGGKVSRSHFGIRPRRCLLCGEDAMVCRLEKNHSIDELRRAADTLIADYFKHKDAEGIAAAAELAVLTEVAVSPKPGLVDRFTSGAHGDMDYYTFQRSAAALQPWFGRFALAGIELKNGTAEELFLRLRVLGQQAEKDMFTATGGINTHKGAIFSFSLLCGALGLYAGEEKTVDGLLKKCGELAAYSLTDFNNPAIPPTHGLDVHTTGGCGGIRQEAARGFPSVRDIGLPALEKALSDGMDLNDAGIAAFLSLAASVEDTNVLYRCGRSGLEHMRSECRNVLLRGISEENLRSLDCDFTDRRISAGGCADLLALTFMLHYVFYGGKTRNNSDAKQADPNNIEE